MLNSNKADQPAGHRFFNWLILLFIGLSCLINIVTINDGHNWGGDFAHYILSAKNLLEGRPYNDRILLNMQITYPPGFPFLLMPLIKIFGINFKIFKLLNVVFWYLSIGCAYFLLRKETARDIAVLFCLLLSILSDFFIYKQNVLSDIPFLFFTLLFFCLFQMYQEQKENRRRWLYFGLMLGALSYSLLVRSAGFITFSSLIFYLVYAGKRREAGWTCLILFLTLVFQFSITGVLSGKFSEAYADPQRFITMMATRSDWVWRTIFAFFVQQFDRPLEIVYAAFAAVIPFVSPFLFGGIIFQFIRNFARKTLQLFDVYLVFYLATLVFMFGFPNNPWGAARFVYPLMIPLIVFIARYGPSVFRSYGQKIGKILILVLIFINIYNVRLKYDFNDNVLIYKENLELIDWIKHNVKDDEAYMLWQALPMALFTGKVGVGYVWMAQPTNLPSFYQYIVDYKISYLILTQRVDRDLIEFYKANPHIAKLVWDNGYYYAFKLLIL